MSKWAQSTVGQVALRVTKGTTPTTLGGSFTDSGITFVKVESIGNDGGFVTSKFDYIDDQTNALLFRSMLQEDDVLFTIAGTIGRVAKVPKSILPANTNQAVAIVRPNPSLIHSKFLFYVLRDKQRILDAQTRVVQSVQANFSLKELSNIKVPLPRLEEQSAIASILGALDNKIDLNRRTNETLEHLARALFKDWFVDFGPTKAKQGGREAYVKADLWALFPERLDSSGKPEGWEAQPLSSFFSIIGGGTPKTSVGAYWDGDIPWFSVVDTPPSGSIFVFDTDKTITQRGLDESAARLVPAGSTIISARGTVGNLAVAARPMTFNQSCYALQGDDEVGDSFVFFAAQHMVARLKGMAHGSVFSTITRQTFDALSLTKPTSHVFSGFEQIAAPLLDRIRANVAESSVLGQTRDLLLPKLMSGELEVKAARQMAEDLL